MPTTRPHTTLRLTHAKPDVAMAVHPARDGVSLQFGQGVYRLSTSQAFELANALTDAAEYREETADE